MSEVATETSMEDILASIKKIIAEDADRKLAPPAPRRVVPREAEYDELGTPISPVAAAEEPEDVLELNDALPHADPVPMPMPEAEIVSAAAAEASRSALSSLSKLVVTPEAPSGDNTLEALVKSMLKPMLKDWLDAHLPEVVERLVANEVARITGR